MSAETKWPQVERRKAGFALDWQSSVEREKAELARTLHDETGGLLVAAVMDLTWTENRLADRPEERARLARARAALDQAVKLNRRIIEELRPTLLENFGLSAALKWHFSEVCKAANIECEHALTDSQVQFSPAAAISLYRTAETLLAILMQHHPHTLLLGLAVEESGVCLKATGKKMEIPYTRDEHNTANGLASVQGRVLALGGEVRVEPVPLGLTIACRMPQQAVLQH